jgi:hypothetical protein
VKSRWFTNRGYELSASGGNPFVDQPKERKNINERKLCNMKHLIPTLLAFLLGSSLGAQKFITANSFTVGNLQVGSNDKGI